MRIEKRVIAITFLHSIRPFASSLVVYKNLMFKVHTRVENYLAVD